MTYFANLPPQPQKQRRIHTTINKEDYKYIKSKGFKFSHIIRDFVRIMQEEKAHTSQQQILKLSKTIENVKKKNDFFQQLLLKISSNLEGDLGAEKCQEFYAKL